MIIVKLMKQEGKKIFSQQLTMTIKFYDFIHLDQ